MFHVCDSVAFSMEGAGGWAASSQIGELINEFKRYMFQAVIISKIEKKKELVVSLEMFDNECKALIDFFEPFEEEQLKNVTYCEQVK